MSRTAQQKKNDKLFFSQLEILAILITIQEEFQRQAFLRQLTESYLAYEKTRKADAEREHNNLVLPTVDINQFDAKFAVNLADIANKFQKEWENAIVAVLAIATAALRKRGVTNSNTIHQAHNSIRQILQPAQWVLMANQFHHNNIPTQATLLQSAHHSMHQHVQTAYNTVMARRVTAETATATDTAKTAYFSDLLSLGYTIQFAQQMQKDFASESSNVIAAMKDTYDQSKELVISPLVTGITKSHHSLASAHFPDSIFNGPFTLFPIPKYTGAKSAEELKAEELNQAAAQRAK